MTDSPLVPTARTPAPVFNIWTPLKAYWPWILGFCLLVGAGVFYWRQSGPQTFSASVIVTATRSSQDALGSAGGIAQAAGLGALVGRSNMVTPFDKFTYLITSPDLAQWQMERRPDLLKTVFADRWDEAGQRWLPPEGLGGLISTADTGKEPSAFTLASRYANSIARRKVGDTEMLRIIYEDTDRARASVLLDWIIRDANEMLRIEEMERSELQAQYLRDRLQDVSIEDYRQTLIALLARQEQTLMLAQAELPFAAERVGSSDLGALPVPRRTVTYTIIALMLSFVLAWMVAILVHARAQRREPVTAPQG